jgi:PIN domain nuclease of toxin-antitoxin system
LRLLLDTHVFLWWAETPERLSAAQREAIESRANDVYFSVASIWEMAIKVGTGRLEFPVSEIEAHTVGRGLTVLPILAPHAVELLSLPRLHGDPFDRMLIAQARAEGLTLVTEDAAIRRYEVALL